MEHQCEKTALACRIHFHSGKRVKWRRFLAPGTFRNGPSPAILKMLLDYGAVIKADAKMTDMTCLMFAAVSDALPVGIARDLIERGADLNVKSSRGLTALDFARRLGATPMVDLLVKAGAKEGIALADPAMHPKPAATFRAAIERSIPLLQRTDVTFLEKAGCVSCHHDNLTAMAVAAVLRNGLHVDDG